MTEKLTFTAFYPHPPERVWKAMTDAKALAAWLLPTDFQPVTGRRFQFKAGGTIQGTVLEVEQNRLLSYTWIDNENGEAGTPSKVTWRLRPRDGGTELRLEHRPAGYVEPMVLIEAEMNWRFALYASLPMLLSWSPRVPIVYGPDEPESPEMAARRAGFRQLEPFPLDEEGRVKATTAGEGS